MNRKELRITDMRTRPFPLAGSRNRLYLLLREAAQSLLPTAGHLITPASLPAAQALRLCRKEPHCIIRMSSWTAGLLRVGAVSPARA
ncbi:hypothetical protein DSY2797 [Desulfitobacterium hafniense Y51]|uniref:Uncharacterized protein n=1 Tax=Desulfitobacterium hafniense (strain Y51) TaxID=138119 RepID=Q24TQ6_DESHY|nr:hypothetical protein DSY2797 [Desulfitobacterium hafniense Y51]